MKLNKLMIVSIWIAALFIGAYSQDRYFNFVTPVKSGMPKTEIPTVGSVLHMEAVFGDGTFVALHAGTRLFYKVPPAVIKTKIALEAGKSYEVVDQKIQNGGHQTILSPIVK
ncbi:MAG: hypothetical protein WCJ74_00010 [bacterium]